MALVLSATCNLSVDLIEKLALLTQSLHILHILLCAIHMSETLIFTTTAAINSLVTVRMTLAAILVLAVTARPTASASTLLRDYRDILAQVMYAQLSLFDRVQCCMCGLRQKLIFRTLINMT